jgi:hypothetical protein
MILEARLLRRKIAAVPACATKPLSLCYYCVSFGEEVDDLQGKGRN